jgi:lantibiotic modifying enzyme
LINRLAYKVITEFYTTNNIDLISGQMGMTIFLFHYARYINIRNFQELAYEYLNNIFNKIDASTSIDFHSGLCGIGWGLEYLVQEKFIDVNTNDILKDVDEKINEVNVERIVDFDSYHGLGGMIHYIIARVYSKNYNNNIDVNAFYRKISFILEDEHIEIDSFDLFLRFTRLQNSLLSRDLDDTSLSLYNLLYLPDDPDCLDSDKLGLDGVSGLGINMIWNKHYPFTLKINDKNE